MKKYRATITGDKYPYEFNSVGTCWAAAVSRAVREWSKTKGKGSRTSQLNIRIVKV